MPLLESKDPKIFAKETVTILHHIETGLVPIIDRDIEKHGDVRLILTNTVDVIFIIRIFQHHTATVFKDYRAENIADILNLMRLACARNLARALIFENTVQ